MNIAIYRLMAGFRRFKDKYFQVNEHHDSLYGKHAHGQHPKTMLIGCADSRVDPAILTGAHPGELFVIRNVANLVPPCEPAAVGFHGTSSALEFAVVNLKVENIIILGHRQCGGIRALLKGPTGQSESFVTQWMSIAQEARKFVIENYPNADENTQCRYAEMESIKVSIKNLHTFPFVKKAIEERNLNIIGIYFDLEEGELWQITSQQPEFHQLEI